MEEYCIFDMQINPHSLSKFLILQRDSILGGLCGTLFAEARYVSQEDRKLGREFHFHFRLAMDGGGDSLVARFGNIILQRTLQI